MKREISAPSQVNAFDLQFQSKILGTNSILDVPLAFKRDTIETEIQGKLETKRNSSVRRKSLNGDLPTKSTKSLSQNEAFGSAHSFTPTKGIRSTSLTPTREKSGSNLSTTIYHTKTKTKCI